MDKRYLQLFKEMSKTIVILAEQVMDYNHKKNDDKGEQHAQTLRDSYQKLYDKLNTADFKLDSLERPDFARLLVGSMIVAQNIEDRIKQQQKAIDGYRIDLIPKLDRILNESNTTEEAIKLANEIFQIIEKD